LVGSPNFVNPFWREESLPKVAIDCHVSEHYIIQSSLLETLIFSNLNRRQQSEKMENQ
jgi:hypothetical protein